MATATVSAACLRGNRINGSSGEVHVQAVTVDARDSSHHRSTSRSGRVGSGQSLRSKRERWPPSWAIRGGGVSPRTMDEKLLQDITIPPLEP